MGDFTVLGLRVVREAARHGSFSTAAETLGYSQSAVSRQIALMEQAAGRPLFERQARGVRLTEAGRLVVRHADVVLGDLRTARQELADLGVRGLRRVRLGAFPTAMAALVPRAVGAFLDREPHTRVPLREGLSPGLLAAVGRGRLDLAVVTAPSRAPDGVELVPLLTDPLLLAVAVNHPLAARARVHPDTLRDQHWITGSTEPDSGLLGAWARGSGQPDIAFVARDWMAKLGLVAAGLGVTLVPGIAVPALPATIAVVRVDDPDAVRHTVVAREAGATDGPVLEALRISAAELSVEVRRRLRHGGRSGVG